MDDCVRKCHLIVEPLPFSRDRVQLFFQDLSSHLYDFSSSQPVMLVSVPCRQVRGEFTVFEVSIVTK